MSLIIASKIVGKKGERKFRIVVREKRSKRDGKFIAILGWYEKGNDNKNKMIDMEQYQHWVSQGAQPSQAIQKLIAK